MRNVKKKLMVDTEKTILLDKGENCGVECHKCGSSNFQFLPDITMDRAS